MADDAQGSLGLTLTSTDFSHQTDIPSKFTCEGENVNPQLKIDGAPAKAKSLALIVDDPDAAQEPAGIGKTFDHWIVFNLDPAVNVIEENAVPTGALQGANSAGQNQYTGPCPPSFKHKYFFKLYALDTELDLPEGANKAQVESAMRDHIIEETELVGLYEKQKPN